MTTYYVDPAASGSNDGSNWTNAWTSLQSAADTAVAGDVVYCRGEQDASATIDFDTNGGTNAGGFIKFIGCNASGNVDGTRFVVDQQSAGRHGFAFSATAVMTWMENIEVKNTGAGTYYGIYCTAQTRGNIFINCCAQNCGSHGFYYRFGDGIFFRCVAYSNGGIGFYNQYSRLFAFCAARDNSDSGFASDGAKFIGCVAHGNTNDGFSLYYNNDGFNCVSDGNSDDGVVIVGHTNTCATFILGFRITNHSGSGDIGLNAASEPLISGFNYFENNDGDNIQNATLHYVIPLEGGSSTSNIEDQSNTNKGYVSETSGSEDFSTGYTDSGDPDLRRTAITIPWS